MRTGPDAPSRRGKGLAWVLAALGALLILAAVARPSHDRGGTAPAHDEVGASRQLPTPAGHPSAAAAARLTPSDAARPVRLTIPSLAVSAPVTAVELHGATLVPPADPQVLGWWSGGSMPGAPRGTAVIAGHTVHTGGGTFDTLGALAPGDRIRLRTTAGPLAYRVTGVSDHSKHWLAVHAPHVFSQTVPGRLALVTCTDWNGTAYESNTVVLATPMRG